jgi:hypothetical protein
MLSVYDLDGFVDQLGDLTRNADPMDIVVEATGLLNDNQAQRFLMQHRAAAAADAHYLHGVSLRKIAQACPSKEAGRSLTTQTIRNWLDEYGPGYYLTIAREEPRPEDPGQWRFVVRLLTVEGDDQLMKRKIREARAAGRRIVPARLDLVDLDQPDSIAASSRWPAPVEQLWEQLGD